MTQMKGSFITAFLLVEFIALLNGFALRAQDERSQMSVKKNNFSTFTRKYTNRGKLWMTRNKAYLRHPDARFGDKYSPNKNAVELFEKRTIDSKFFINQDTPTICYVSTLIQPNAFQKKWTMDYNRCPAYSKGPITAMKHRTRNIRWVLIFKENHPISLLRDGATYFNNWKLYGENEGTETLLASADWTNYTAGDDGIAIKNIFPGIDAEMKVSRGSIKTNFIVHANKFPTYDTLLFRDSFLGGRPGNFTFSNGLRKWFVLLQLISV